MAERFPNILPLTDLASTDSTPEKGTTTTTLDPNVVCGILEMCLRATPAPSQLFVEGVVEVLKK